MKYLDLHAYSRRILPRQNANVQFVICFIRDFNSYNPITILYVNHFLYLFPALFRKFPCFIRKAEVFRMKLPCFVLNKRDYVW